MFCALAKSIESRMPWKLRKKREAHHVVENPRAAVWMIEQAAAPPEERRPRRRDAPEEPTRTGNGDPS
jgi:hypothetical protein